MKTPGHEVTLQVAQASDAAGPLIMMDDFNAGEAIAVDPDRLRTALDRLLADQGLGRIWLVSSDGEPVGYAVLTFGYDLEYAGRDAFLTELYLVPRARGRGVAR